MNRKNKVLVVYASPFGSTFQIAEVVAQELYQAGYSVTLEETKKIKDISNYYAVIIGGPIQYDKWISEVKYFINTFENDLAKIPVAYFYTCLTKVSKSTKAIEKIMNYSNFVFNTSKVVKPISVECFAGVLDYKKMPLVQEYFSRFIYLFLGVKEGDYRNWKNVYSWSKKLVEDIKIGIEKFQKAS